VIETHPAHATLDAFLCRIGQGGDDFVSVAGSFLPFADMAATGNIAERTDFDGAHHSPSPGAIFPLSARIAAIASTRQGASSAQSVPS
jgi:hypothetical protein